MEVSSSRMRSRHGCKASWRALREACSHWVSVSRRDVCALAPTAAAKPARMKSRRPILFRSKPVTRCSQIATGPRDYQLDSEIDSRIGSPPAASGAGGLGRGHALANFLRRHVLNVGRHEPHVAERIDHGPASITVKLILHR